MGFAKIVAQLSACRLLMLTCSRCVCPCYPSASCAQSQQPSRRAHDFKDRPHLLRIRRRCGKARLPWFSPTFRRLAHLMAARPQEGAKAAQTGPGAWLSPSFWSSSWSRPSLGSSPSSSLTPSPEQRREPPPEPPTQTRRRSWVIASLWAIVLFVGLPIWWRTTTIYRAELPLGQMLDWADGKVYNSAPPVFVSWLADRGAGGRCRPAGLSSPFASPSTRARCRCRRRTTSCV
jgi:hypothetical protein